MDEPMETAGPSEAVRSGIKPDSTLDREGAPREWWDDSFQDDLEGADFHDDSFDATDEALLLGPDNCKYFGFLFL